MMKRGTTRCALLLVTIGATAQQQRFDGKSWWHHIEILAADDMEGRGTGARGLDRAEAYVVGELKKSGLAPAGSHGYYQPVPFESRQIVQSDSSAALVHNGRAEPLVLGEDAVLECIASPAPRIEAPLVFLGYGLRVPEMNHDDFAGRDLKGKVAVTMVGSPGITGPLAAHYLAIGRRWQEFREVGLVGWILIPTPYVAGVSGTIWSHLVDYIGRPKTDLAGDEFDDASGGQFMLRFNPAHADKLFQDTGHTAAELFALAKDHKPLPRFDLPIRIRATARMLKKPLESANVVARLEGSDPKLKSEYVVLSAHIDHLGIGKLVNGDAIYNGAFDNASGCAALLEIAAELKKEGVRPRRSVLFVFFTAEELGMLGSKYFTAHPPVDPKSIVADLNVDTIHAIVPLKEVAVIGLDESDLGDAARRAAASQNIAADAEVALHPKTTPDGSMIGIISGSDHASFVFRGIPAVILKVGFPGEQAALLEKYRRYPHHTPFDDVHQPVILETAAKYEEIMLQLLLDVANNPHRPRWKPTSFYKRYAAM